MNELIKARAFVRPVYQEALKQWTVIEKQIDATAQSMLDLEDGQMELKV